MSKKLTPQGNVESEKNIEDKKVRTPVLTQSLSGAKVDPQGYLYKEEEIDGIIGYIPVVSIEGSGGGGAVTSVNTKTGDVVLGATDVGAASTAELSAETLARQTTDTGLQTQINALPTPVNADWNAASGLAEFKNNPVLENQQDIDNSIANGVIGNNLIRNSNFQTTDFWRLYVTQTNGGLSIDKYTGVATVTVDNSTSGQILVSNKMLLKTGVEYILSVDIRSNDFVALGYTYIISAANGNQSLPSFTGITPQWKRFSVKVVPTLDRDGAIAIGANGLSAITGTKSFQVRNVKLETGVASNTVYTPSALDYNVPINRNLLKNGDCKTLNGYANNQNTTLTLVDSGIQVVTNQITSTPGLKINNIVPHSINKSPGYLEGVYTVTLDIDLTKASGAVNLLVYNLASNTTFSSHRLMNGVNEITTVPIPAGTYMFIIIFSSPIRAAGSFILKRIKLEKGSVATSWVNALEDVVLTSTPAYEEGTWTPVVEGSSTQGVAQYTVNNARYVRTGNMITAFFDTSGKFTTTPTGTCVIKGLPYQGGNNANGVFSLSIGYAEQNVYFTIQGNTLVSKKQNGKNSDIVAAVFGTDLSNTNFHLYGNVSYFIG